MTNTESHVAVGLEELAASDDAQAVDPIDENLTAEDIRELDAYGFDSEHRTLVGLGPVERARRSRRTAEIPDSQRMPPSEPPGPFIANDDEEDAEALARALRGGKLGPWSLAVPTALALAAASVVLVRGLASPAPAPAVDKPVLAAGAPRATEKPSPKVELTQLAAPVTAVESANEHPDAQPAVVEPASHSSAVAVPVAPPALPVKLPELAPPAAIDMSPGAGESVGTLDISSSPPANVVLDGRPLGKAPRLVRLPPGAHTLLFIHPLYGRQSLSVNVSSGHTTQASVDF